MWDSGVLRWLRREVHRRAALVRQISNPIAGTDNMLLALMGAGCESNKVSYQRGFGVWGLRFYDLIWIRPAPAPQRRLVLRRANGRLGRARAPMW